MGLLSNIKSNPIVRKTIATGAVTAAIIGVTYGFYSYTEIAKDNARLRQDVEALKNNEKFILADKKQAENELSKVLREKRELQAIVDMTQEETKRKQAPVARGYGRRMLCNVSAYTASAEENGGDGSGMTASGNYAQAGRTIAMDGIPFGTRVLINGNVYVVEDRFGGGYTDRIDIFMDSYDDAIQFGRQYIEVEILD